MNTCRVASRAFLLAIACALTLSGAPAGAEPPATSAIPARDFARKSVFVNARISPNGEYLAVTNWTPAGQLALAIVDIKSLKVAAVLRFGRGEHVADFWWVGPDRVVASVATVEGPLDQPRLTGELWGISADGKPAAYLFGYRGKESIGTRITGAEREYTTAVMLDPMPEDPRHALIAVYSWHEDDPAFPLIYRMNVYNGNKEPAGRVPAYAPLDVAADKGGKPRFAYGMDDKSDYHGYAWSDEKNDWVELKFPGGAPKHFTDAVVSADGASAFTVTSDGSDTSCLDEITLATREVRQVSCGSHLNGGALMYSLAGDRRPVGVLMEGPQLPRFFDAAHPDAKLMQVLQNSFPGERVRITSATIDSKKLVLHVDGDRNPGDFYLLDRDTRKADYLMSTRDWIDPRRMQAMQVVDYKARDGTVIHAYLTLPVSGAKKVPLVVIPHGGPHGVRDRWAWDAWAQFLASRGYGVLQPNFRGSGGYGYAFEHAGYRKWGTAMIDDISDGARWAVEQGYADASRMCVFGASYGGYAALMSVVREPDLYRCGIGFAGVYDLESQIDDSDIGDRLMGRNYIEKALGTDSKLLAEQSPITHVERLKAPVLIIHGTADKRVPFSQAKQLRKALDKQKKPYEWMEISGEEHGFYKDENNEAFLNRIAEFLDKHIGKSASVAVAPAN